MTSTQIPGFERSIFASGYFTKQTSSFSRSANTAAYIATSTNGQVINNSSVAANSTCFTWTVGRVPGGTGVITQMTLLDKSAQSTRLSSEVWVFNTTVAQSSDYAAWAPTAAEMANLVGVVSFATPIVSTVHTVYDERNVNMDFQCNSTGQLLYGYLVGRNGYTPASTGGFRCVAKARQD